MSLISSHPCPVQGYLAQKKPPPRRTLQYDHAWGVMGVLGGWAFSYERGNPVGFGIEGFRGEGEAAWGESDTEIDRGLRVEG